MYIEWVLPYDLKVIETYSNLMLILMHFKLNVIQPDILEMDVTGCDLVTHTIR